MKLLVIVLCLLSERFLIHGISYQRFSWFNNYCSTVLDNIAGKITNPSVILSALVLPIVFIVTIIYFIFHNALFGLVGFILNLIIFLYCLGPQNAFYPLSESDSTLHENQRAGDYLAQTNTQLFAPVFWFLVGGPIIVLAYRVITLCQQVEPVSKIATQLTEYLEWIPARLAVLLFLLVGNFQTGFPLFSNQFLSNPTNNNQFLGECGVEAAKANPTDEDISLPQAERLVEHAAIVLLVFVALLILGTTIY